MTPVLVTKVCPQCGIEKPLFDYAEDRRRPDGRDGWCRSCRAAKARERRRETRTTAPGTREPAPPVVRGERGDGPHVRAEERENPESAADAPWPVPLDPTIYAVALVERRRRVIDIYRRLDEQIAAGPNPGRRGPDDWQRKVYGDGRSGGQDTG